MESTGLILGFRLLLLDTPTITTITPPASVPAEAETVLYISGSGFESSMQLACIFSAERGDAYSREVVSTANIYSDDLLSCIAPAASTSELGLDFPMLNRSQNAASDEDNHFDYLTVTLSTTAGLS